VGTGNSICYYYYAYYKVNGAATRANNIGGGGGDGMAIIVHLYICSIILYTFLPVERNPKQTPL